MSAGAITFEKECAQRKLSFAVVIFEKYQILKKLGSVLYILHPLAIFWVFCAILAQNDTKCRKYGKMWQHIQNRP